MDDALIQSALDISGRAHFVWDVEFSTAKIGFFDVELVKEFFNAFSSKSEMTLHVNKLAGVNSHHIAEATFKSVAKSIRYAIELDPKQENMVPSTKGVL
jgi:imidazoleglycerol-phosphate dehydratase